MRIPPKVAQASHDKRSARAALRRRIAAGVIPIGDVLRHPPEYLRTKQYDTKPMTLARILSWQRGWGLPRAELHLAKLRMGPWLTPFDLSRTRREQLARAVENVSTVH